GDLVGSIPLGIHHRTDARARDQLHAFADHRVGIDDDQTRIPLGPDAARIRGAFACIAFADRIVIGDLVFVVGLGVLIALLCSLILLQLILILFLLRPRLRIDSGIVRTNLIVDRGGFGFFRRRGFIGGIAVGV